MARLYAALRQDGRLTGEADQAAIARILNVAQQNVNNWESRGLSKEGALDAQRKAGISAVWLLFGEGPKTIDGGWPFKSFTKTEITMLEYGDRRELEGIIRAELRHISSSRATDATDKSRTAA